MNRQVFLTLVFAAAALAGRAAATAGSPARPSVVARYGNGMGFYDTRVTALATDGYGFLWIGTEAGLHRLDGHSVSTSLWPGQAVGGRLSRMNVAALAYDKVSSRLYVGGRAGGLYRIDIATGDASEIKVEGRTAPPVSSLVAAGAGTLWAATFHDGLYKIDVMGGRVSHYSLRQGSLAADSLTGMALDTRRSLLYIGTRSAGLMQMRLADCQVRLYGSAHGLPPTVHSVRLDSRRHLWCATSKGLALFDRKSRRFRLFASRSGDTSSLPADNVLEIADDADGHLWVGTECGGVSVTARPVEGEPKRLDFVSLTPHTAPALSNKTVRAIAPNRFGSVYVGTYGDGIDVVSLDNRRSCYAVSYPLRQKEATALLYDSRLGTLVVGMDGAGIDIFTSRDGGASAAPQTLHPAAGRPTALGDGAVTAAMLSREGRWWLGTYGGCVAVYDPKSGRWTTPVARLNDVRAFAQTASGEVIIAHGAGLTLVAENGTGRIRTVRLTLARTAAVDSRGRIYAGTQDNGLYVFSPELQLLRHLPSATVNHLLVDSAAVWVATESGLLRLSTADWRLEPVSISEADPCVRSLLRARDGSLWLAARNHIYRYYAATGRTADYTFLAGRLADGFSPRAAALGAGNTVCFASHNGVVSFDPTALPHGRLPRPQFSTMSEPSDTTHAATPKAVAIAGREEVRLRDGMNTVTVTFSVLDPQYAGKVEYAYRLMRQGRGTWYSNGTSQSLTLHNLPHGTYRLEVRARMPYQPWTDEAASLRIVIDPPLWLSWWALALYAAAAMAVAAGVYMSVRRRLMLRRRLAAERRNTERERQTRARLTQFFT